jgi:hypothetical protein
MPHAIEDEHQHTTTCLELVQGEQDPVTHAFIPHPTEGVRCSTTGAYVTRTYWDSVLAREATQ